MAAPPSITPRLEITLRRATAADAPAITILSEELGYPLAEDVVRSRMAHLAVLPEHAIIVAELEATVCGWVHVHAHRSLVSGERADVFGLVVSRDVRRRGIGRILMAEAERWARDRGLDLMVLRSNVQRPESHAFYPAIGYEQFRTQAVYRKLLS
ncbi:MAG TPA: GNAT family N-acetyltransferase [Chthoniobacterales bacterium]|nr:GNAT family N-acetyltransferase [Chthoniobacterales bacterium]